MTKSLHGQWVLAMVLATAGEETRNGSKGQRGWALSRRPHGLCVNNLRVGSIAVVKADLVSWPKVVTRKMWPNHRKCRCFGLLNSIWVACFCCIAFYVIISRAIVCRNRLPRNDVTCVGWRIVKLFPLTDIIVVNTAPALVHCERILSFLALVFPQNPTDRCFRTFSVLWRFAHDKDAAIVILLKCLHRSTKTILCVFASCY